MVSINYIIATYEGHNPRRDVRENENLQIHMRQLFKQLKITKAQVQITVVCPTVRGAKIPNYYNKEFWLKEAEKDGIKLVYTNYDGANKHYSYDQWIQGYLKFPTYDYHVLIEDDYYITDSLDKLVSLYKTYFPNNIGYLASYYGTTKGHNKTHLAISNGIISKESFEKVPDILSYYYRLSTIKNPQVPFGDIFLNSGVPIKDFRKEYNIYFWEANPKYKTFTNFRHKIDNPSYFVPCQKDIYTKGMSVHSI